MTRSRAKTRPGFAPATPEPTDPMCVAGPGGTPCGGCHWCLRAAHGPLYWLGPNLTDETVEAAIELLAPDAGPPKAGPRRKR